MAAQLTGVRHSAVNKNVCVYLCEGLSEGDRVPERPLFMW